ncbi:hypothetical protein B0H11DRAFT_2210433 [Mycena galericulata]|nr:hypothetical protein B0H11DRAFT_2210433 [Mycena galericulata]
MQAWAYGSMTPQGNRMPMGGIKGDGYGLYACHSGDSVDDIKALFRHAVDSDILATVAKTIHPQIESDLLEVTEGSELNRFGRFGATAYYCTNFISCVHSDKDVIKEGRPTLHPCIQLWKEKCGPNDYNFGMVRWGIVIRTEENTVWVFDGCDEHGTIIPSKSSVAGGAMSSDRIQRSSKGSNFDSKTSSKPISLLYPEPKGERETSGISGCGRKSGASGRRPEVLLSAVLATPQLGRPRLDGGEMGIEDSGGNHVTPDGAGQVPEGVQSDPEDAGSNRRKADGSGQAPLEPNTT